MKKYTGLFLFTALCVLNVIIIIMVYGLSNKFELGQKSSLLQLNDIQRSIGSFDTVMEALVTGLGARRVTVFKLQSVDGTPLTVDSNMTLNVVATLTRYANGETITPLLSVRSLNIYLELLPTLFDHKVAFRKTTEMTDGALKTALLARGTKVAAWIAIVDKKGDVVGILAVGWLGGDQLPTPADYPNFETILRGAAASLAMTFNNVAPR